MREKRGLSVNKAATLIGTNKSTLTALENGRINLSSEWIEKIIKVYRFNKEAFHALKMEKLSSKDNILMDINERASKLSYEKLLIIKQLLDGFS